MNLRIKMVRKRALFVNKLIKMSVAFFQSLLISKILTLHYAASFFNPLLYLYDETCTSSYICKL